ncbi:AraC family ligand binding domain-containing protein [Streptomyces griseus]|uniref:AraC family ligand binding domain-containing protein n=1 Tax=Streptomyces griseus TaxID=1911 RepID=UPI0036685600
MNAAPRVLAVIEDLLAAAAPDERGALWHLAEQGRELDANLVRLPPGAEVGEHQEDVLDVLLVVLAGAGSARAGGRDLPLGPGTVLWLPRTSQRALAAGPDGLTYLTVHRRRPGLAIKPPAGAYEGGEGPCMLDRVCPECGRLSQDPAPVFCSRCGERFPER